MSRRIMLILAGAMVAVVVAGVPADDPPAQTDVGRAGRPPDPPARHGRGARLTEKQEKEVLDAVKERKPEFYKQLIDLRESSPGRYRRALAGLWRLHQRLRYMPKEEREAVLAEQDARRKVYRLARAARQEKDAAKAARLKQELREAVAAQFQAEQTRFEVRLVQLAKRIKRHEAELKDRKARRDEIIAERFARALEGRRGPTTRRQQKP